MPISDDEFDKQFGTLARYPVPRSPDRQYGWGDRLGASVDSAQAALLGVGEEIGLDTGDARRRNQFEADYARRRSIDDTGAPRRIADIDGPTSLAKGAAGLLVDSAPQLATSLGAGLIAGPVAGLGTAWRLAAAGAAGYPFNYGDVLQSQREEAGITRPGVAAALAVPYTAVDMLGLDALAATGKGLRVGKYLDDIAGKTGVAARMGANTGLNALVEGGSETFQEGANQLGRMAVNPDQTFFNGEANERYQESFLGGALLGGAISAPMGSWRRSEGYQSPLAQQAAEAEQGQTADLLSPMPPEVVNNRPTVQMLDMPLERYGPGDGPAYRPVEQQQDTQLDQQVPGQREMFYPNGEATYAADAGGDAPLLSAYDAATQRAGVARTRLGNPDGFDQDAPAPGNLDQLELPQRALQAIYQQAAVKADAGQALTPFETKVLETYSTRPNPQARLDVAPERGQFRLDGGPTPQFDNTPVEPRPEFELVPSNQGQLDLRDPAEHPIVRQLADEKKGQRGVTQQLAFNAETASPKGQVLMGLADSLLGEQHLDESTHVQVSTMIAQSKFAAAKKVLDEALKEKAAADTLIAKVEKLAEKEVNAQQTKVDKGAAPTSSQAPANTLASGAPAAAGTATSAPVTPSAPVVANQPGSSAVAQEPRDYAQAVKSLPAAEKKKAKALMGRIDRMEQLIKCLKNQRLA